MVCRRLRSLARTNGVSAKEGDPESIKVRDWRHKLQKTFLSNKGLPKNEVGELLSKPTPPDHLVQDMPDLDRLFTQVEECNITIAQLQVRLVPFHGQICPLFVLCVLYPLLRAIPPETSLNHSFKPCLSLLDIRSPFSAVLENRQGDASHRCTSRAQGSP